MKIEIDIPSDIWKTMKGGNVGIELPEEIMEKGIRGMFYTKIIEEFKEIDNVKQWAISENEKLSDGMSMKALFTAIADAL